MNNFDIIIINNCPAFYKILLYNELAKQKKIYVIFLGHSDQVEADIHEKEFTFSYKFINANVRNRSIFRSALSLIWTLLQINANKVIIGGYDFLELLIPLFLFRKSQLVLQSESSVREYRSYFFADIYKCLVLRRYGKALVPSIDHERLLRHFSSDITVFQTGGVGLMRSPSFDCNSCDLTPLKFLYVGRLIRKKSLDVLIEVFNELGYHLTVVGNGEMFVDLETRAMDNIIFRGHVRNELLSSIYYSHSVFILPSLVEPWGLVVEEAILHHLPVIVSSKVGCRTEIVEKSGCGVVFEAGSKEDLGRAISEIVKKFSFYKENTFKWDNTKRAASQVKVYLNI
jgi:glycosyltransferase involved in cell wall biosynthesis